jgi:hypothetical protein
VRHLDLLDPHGRSVRVPTAWTDHGLPDERAFGIGAKSRVSAPVLNALVRLVETIDAKKVDDDVRAAKMPRPEHMVSYVNADAEAKAGGHFMDGHSGRSAEPRARRARKRRAAATTKRRGKERGPR